MESWLLALVTAVITGLVTWGGIRVELRWLRRDVDWAHRRIDQLDRRGFVKAPALHGDGCDS